MNKENQMNNSILNELAETYPQLYLDPDSSSTEQYRAIVLRGERPEICSLDHFATDEKDSMEYVETPAGEALVISLFNRHDFELFIRCMMAAKDGPDAEVPETMGASTLITFNWNKIYAHKAEFMEEQRTAGVAYPDWDSEFRRFISFKENYQDMLIVLSHIPYSNVTLDQVNLLQVEGGYELLDESAWVRASDDIRKYHELTHFVCRRLYPDLIDAVRDELIADAVGICAAFGEYRRDLEELFLGISGDRYTGGRLENYTGEDTDMDDLAKKITAVLKGFEKKISEAGVGNIFDLMSVLQLYAAHIENSGEYRYE